MPVDQASDKSFPRSSVAPQNRETVLHKALALIVLLKNSGSICNMATGNQVAQRRVLSGDVIAMRRAPPRHGGGGHVPDRRIILPPK